MNSLIFGFILGVAMTWAVSQSVMDILDQTDDTRLDRAVKNWVRTMKQGMMEATGDD